MIQYIQGGDKMKKRFFQPVWKFEEIENQLTFLEENGWRLNKIRGFRCFEFVKSTPKTVQYFFTYSLTREKLNMNLIEMELKNKIYEACINAFELELDRDFIGMIPWVRNLPIYTAIAESVEAPPEVRKPAKP